MILGCLTLFLVGLLFFLLCGRGCRAEVVCGLREKRSDSGVMGDDASLLGNVLYEPRLPFCSFTPQARSVQEKPCLLLSWVILLR